MAKQRAGRDRALGASPNARIVAREPLSRQGRRVYAALEAIDDPEPFEGVLLNDVLEHVTLPVEFVTSLRRHMHPRSVAWVDVPTLID